VLRLCVWRRRGLGRGGEKGGVRKASVYFWERGGGGELVGRRRRVGWRRRRVAAAEHNFSFSALLSSFPPGEEEKLRPGCAAGFDRFPRARSRRARNARRVPPGARRAESGRGGRKRGQQPTEDAASRGKEADAQPEERPLAAASVGRARARRLCGVARRVGIGWRRRGGGSRFAGQLEAPAFERLLRARALLAHLGSLGCVGLGADGCGLGLRSR